MKQKQQHSADFGLTAMPLFCSLLGATLILVLCNMSAKTPPMSEDKIKDSLGKLARVRAAANQTVALQNTISNRLNLAEYQAANARLDTEIAEKLKEVKALTNTVSQAQLLQGRLAEVRRQTEIDTSNAAAAKTRIADLEARVNAATTNIAIWLFGGYHGSNVLIECDSDGATVYPEGRKLAVDAPEPDFEPVFTNIDRAGFVTIVARPGGLTTSYNHVRQMVDEHLQQANVGRANPIGICAFPLDTNASLAMFLQKGVM
jgi:hypothetical protein